MGNQYLLMGKIIFLQMLMVIVKMMVGKCLIGGAIELERGIVIYLKELRIDYV